MKEELIRKIEKSNLPKNIKKQLIDAISKDDYVKFLKTLYYSIGILDFFEIDLEQIKKIVQELIE